MGDKLFAGAALAANQHRAFTLRDTRDLAEHVLHRARIADHVGWPAAFTKGALQPFIFVKQPLSLFHGGTADLDRLPDHRGDYG